MKNRGFTLLELLGVIVILALLTTLVFPSVLNAIKKSSDQTDKLSMDLINNAADLYIENHANEFIKYNGNKYTLEIEELMNDGNLPSNIKISDIDNIEDVCIQVTYQDYFKYELKQKGTCERNIKFGSICKLTSDSTTTGTNAGAKYSCKVDPNKDPYTFYVLTTPKEGDTTINLIMDRNICEDGTPTDANKEDKCLVAYNSSGDAAGVGPVTAMTYLNNATSLWKNIDNLDLTYDDEGTIFTGFALNGKARLPYKSEVSSYDSTNNTNAYLYDYLNQSGTIQTNAISEIYGYWTLSSAGSYDGAWYVDYCGYVSTIGVDGAFHYGVRPVVNLKI